MEKDIVSIANKTAFCNLRHQQLQIDKAKHLTPTSNEELLTMAQMAERLGVSTTTVQRRVKELGLTPTVPYSPPKVEGGAPTAALYSYAAYRDMQQQQQQLHITMKKEEALQRTVAAIPPVAKERVMADYIAELDADESNASTEAMLFNAAGFMSMLKNRLDKLHNKTRALEAENLLLAGKVETLENELERVGVLLDLTEAYASVKRMELKYHDKVFNWRPLKKWALENQSTTETPLMGKVFDQNYGEVNTYHETVWKAVYDITI